MPGSTRFTASRIVRDLARKPLRVQPTVRRNINIQRVPTTVHIPNVSIPEGIPTGIPKDYDPLSMLRAIRPDDLSNGVFRFHDLQRNLFANVAQRQDPLKEAFLVLDLPGQHIGEEAVPEHATNSQISPPLRARIAGRSRLAVRMPQGTANGRLRLEDLLDAMSSWPLSLDPLARYTEGGLRTEMLRAVESSFVSLSLLVWAELSELGLFTIVHRATTLGAPLVDQAHAFLSAGIAMPLTNRAAWVRAAVETAAETLADEPVDRYIGSEPEWQVREVAEAQMEVYFALHFARRLLASGDEFDNGRLQELDTSGNWRIEA